eukprot:418174_1
MGIGQSSEKKLLANNAFECALYATQGYRKGMEDAHLMNLSLPNHPSHSLFGVFDGFNGNDASTYFADHIADVLDDIKDIQDDDAIIKAVCDMDAKYLASDLDNPNAGCTFVFAIINTVDLADMTMSRLSLQPMASDTPYIYSNSVSSLCSRSFTANSNYDSSNLKYCSSSNLSSISTASCDADKAFRVRVFWAGDARAVLMSDNRHFQRLTDDHHCSVATEAQRIVNAKGKIINDRIDGIVEVSRGFGCRAMKSDASLPFDEQKMISVPDHTTVICGNYNRLLLFCDGLTKKWTDKQFNVRCKHHVMQQKDDKKSEYKAIKYLCKQAMDEGSKDNITALSIRFK